MTAALTDHVTASLAYTYLDARYTESSQPRTTAFSIAGGGNCTVGTVGPQVVCFVNTNGNRLDFSSSTRRRLRSPMRPRSTATGS
ncbi:MAG: hypothetical protein U1F18_15675 [Steroidobacteraceae bacterium]